MINLVKRLTPSVVSAASTREIDARKSVAITGLFNVFAPSQQQTDHPQLYYAHT